MKEEMINHWNEIQSRFEAIKDHKPKAPRKLNELGEILSSAYVFNPEEADRMWTYLTDLNVKDNISNAKYYIAQIFNKLSERMKPEEATSFLCMDPQRLKNLIVHGYEGASLWSCLDTIIHGFIQSGDIAGAITCFDFFSERDAVTDSGASDMIKAASAITLICIDHMNRHDHYETAKQLLFKMSHSANEGINAYVEILKTLNVGAENPNYEWLLRKAMEYRYSVEFFDLLWLARNEIDEVALRDLWIEYLHHCGPDDPVPLDSIPEEDLKNLDGYYDYGSSRLRFYVDLVKETDTVLDHYYNSNKLSDLENGLIWVWVEQEDWTRFTKYVAKSVISTPDETFFRSSLKQTLDEYLWAFFYDSTGDTLDDYGRSYKNLIHRHGEGMPRSLVEISALTAGCGAHDSYHFYIKVFIQKHDGNLDLMNQHGFSEKPIPLSGEEWLKEFVHNFFAKGGTVFNYSDSEYFMVQRALHEDIYGSHGGNIRKASIDITNYIVRAGGMESVASEKDKKQESLDEREWNRDYRLALDGETAAFFFQHSPEDYTWRKKLLSACIRKGDFQRATELIDMMAATKGNAGYDDLNGWGRRNMLTLSMLIDEYAYDAKEPSDFSDYEIDLEYPLELDLDDDITEEMRSAVRELVYRMMPYLPDKSALELKTNELSRIDPEGVDQEEFIRVLLEDVNIYTTFPKPRGKGGAPNINRMSENIASSFKQLARAGRLDVIITVMQKLAYVRDILKPVPYSAWMNIMTYSIPYGDVFKLFRMDKQIFIDWLEDPRITGQDIRDITRRAAAGCSRSEFLEFRDMVIHYKGRIPGLNACYRRTSENTKAQTMADGKTVKIDLDFIRSVDNFPVPMVEVHFITHCKNPHARYLHLTKCETDGAEYLDYLAEEESDYEYSADDYDEDYADDCDDAADYDDDYADDCDDAADYDEDYADDCDDAVDSDENYTDDDADTDFFQDDDIGEADSDSGLFFPLYEDSTEEFLIDSDFLEENDIIEINRLALHFTVLDYEGDPIEDLEDIIIELDEESGDYIVVQKEGE